jgi:hypothetical protein
MEGESEREVSSTFSGWKNARVPTMARVREALVLRLGSEFADGGGVKVRRFGVMDDDRGR